MIVAAAAGDAVLARHEYGRHVARLVVFDRVICRIDVLAAARLFVVLVVRLVPRLVRVLQHFDLSPRGQ